MMMMMITLKQAQRVKREDPRGEEPICTSAPVQKEAVLHDPYSDALCMLT